jgi:putative transposase
LPFVLRQVEDGTAIGDPCREAGIGEATFLARRKTHAGPTPSQMKCIRQLVDENVQLKKRLADLSSDEAMG